MNSLADFNQVSPTTSKRKSTSSNIVCGNLVAHNCTTRWSRNSPSLIQVEPIPGLNSDGKRYWVSSSECWDSFNTTACLSSIAHGWKRNSSVAFLVVAYRWRWSVGRRCEWIQHCTRCRWRRRMVGNRRGPHSRRNRRTVKRSRSTAASEIGTSSPSLFFLLQPVFKSTALF